MLHDVYCDDQYQFLKQMQGVGEGNTWFWVCTAMESQQFILVTSCLNSPSAHHHVWEAEYE